MIKVEMTVREALSFVTSSHCSVDMFEKIVKSFETALGVDHRCSVTITNGMSLDNRLPCIRAIRKHTGWGLKESKAWTDPVTGYYSGSGHWVSGGNDNTLRLKDNETAESLLVQERIICLGRLGIRKIGKKFSITILIIINWNLLVANWSIGSIRLNRFIGLV